MNFIKVAIHSKSGFHNNFGQTNHVIITTSDIYVITLSEVFPQKFMVYDKFPNSRFDLTTFTIL